MGLLGTIFICFFVHLLIISDETNIKTNQLAAKENEMKMKNQDRFNDSIFIYIYFIQIKYN